MIELIGSVAGPLTGVTVLAAIVLVARLVNLKLIIALWSEHLEMRATVRKMRSEGASDKQVVRFLADHATARAGRSP